MEYNKTSWIDYETVITAEAMNNIEYGIENIATMTIANESLLNDIKAGAPPELDSLKGIANALGNDPNFATNINAKIKAKADQHDHPYAQESHTHRKEDILNFPISLPANGGNADTVNGKTVEVNVPANAKFTDTIYEHPNANGYRHIPAGGSDGKYLKWESNGSAVWADIDGGVSNLKDGSSKGSVVSKPEDDSFTFTPGSYSFSFGQHAASFGEGGIAMGDGVMANGANSHAVGRSSIAYGECSHAEGGSTGALGNYSHAEGQITTADGNCSHAEGYDTKANGNYSHTEGYKTITHNGANHAEGVECASGLLGTMSNEWGSHAEGYKTTATGQGSHSEGMITIAGAMAAHAEGWGSEATAQGSHAEGASCKAKGSYSHAEGYKTTASGGASHAEGASTIASASYAHAEGYGTEASGDYSHAEGVYTVANYYGTHAEGGSTTASGYYAHAQGINTTAPYYAMHSMGRYNKVNAGSGNSYSTIADALVIGNGNSSSSTSNAFRVTFDGKTYGLSAFNSTGADYAEYFEWEDGNPNNEDRIGHFVTLKKDKIRIAQPEDDYVLGIISGNQSIIGNACEDSWNNMYIRDKFDRLQYEEVEVEQEEYVFNKESEEVEIVKKKVTENIIKLNPDYNPNVRYIPRSQRKEWGIVGMMGQIKVLDDGTCEEDGYCNVGKDGIATSSNNGYRVMKRIDDNTILVLFR